MLLSRRPSGLAFYVSSTLLAFFAITILYHLWGFDFRPYVPSTDSPAAPAHSNTVHAKPDTNQNSDPKIEYDWDDPPDLPGLSPVHSQLTPTPTPATTPIPTSLELSSATPTSTPTPPVVANTTGIPKKLWYKLGPAGLSDEAKGWTDSCIKANPNYASEFMTDEAADVWVAETYSSRSDIVGTYLNLTIPILKADFLRYLLLFNKGGIWSDLDVSCKETPIDEWIPEKYRDKASMVVGWEFDVGWGDSFVRQFTSWTIMSKAGTDFMSTVIEDILVGLKEKMDANNVTEVADLELKMVGDVVDITGPRRLTQGTLKSLEKSLGKQVPIQDIALLLEPKLVGDLLIMPGYSFANSANKYDKYLDEERLKIKPLVEHHYAGSWKNDQGGESAIKTDDKNKEKTSGASGGER